MSARLDDPERERRPVSAREFFAHTAEDYDRMNAARGLPSIAEIEDRQYRRLVAAMRAGAVRKGVPYSRAQVEEFVERFGLDPERHFVTETLDLDHPEKTATAAGPLGHLDAERADALLSASQRSAREKGCPVTGRTLRYVTVYRLHPRFHIPRRD